MGPRSAGPAAATPPPMTNRLTPTVSASERIARARWSATVSMISIATSSPAEAARKTSAAVGWARQDGAAAGSQRLLGLASDRRASCDGLEAAVQAACTDDAIRVGGHVAHLAGKAVVAAEQGSVEDDPGRDPGPDGEEGDARRRLSPAVGRLPAQPERRRAGVVLDEDRDSQRLLQQRSQRQVADAEVDGHADRARLGVDPAGDRDADRGDLPPQLAPCVVDQPRGSSSTSDDRSVGATCS